VQLAPAAVRQRFPHHLLDDTVRAAIRVAMRHDQAAVSERIAEGGRVQARDAVHVRQHAGAAARARNRDRDEDVAHPLGQSLDALRDDVLDVLRQR
jgi:hypothetical protein